MALILVVDDEPGIRRMLDAALRADGHRVLTEGDPRKALEILREETIDLLVTDLAMPGMNGVELMRRGRAIAPDMPAIVVTAYGSKETAIGAMRQGAVNYLEKPFDVEEMRLHVRNALDQSRLTSENRRLKARLSLDGRMVGSAPSMLRVREMIARIGPSDSTVLITGESGTGKELAARAIHEASSRAPGPFVGLNCAAIPAELLESELFGHEKGAFTGADRARRGLIEGAEGGVLFLDEIGDMPLEMQAKLLRVLQERQIRRVGGSDEIRVNVRVIAATHRELERLVETGRFREDLYYRIHVIHLELPPLRERREDIPELVRRFAMRHAERMGRTVDAIAPEFVTPLLSLDWPGNVRQLENVVERAVALSADGVIDADVLPHEMFSGPRRRRRDDAIPDEFDIESHIESERARLMRLALAECGEVQTRAATRLGMTFRSFRYFAKKYGLASHAKDENGAGQPVGVSSPTEETE